MTNCPPNSSTRKPNSLKLDVELKAPADFFFDGDGSRLNYSTGIPLNLQFNDITYSVRTGILSQGRRKLLDNMSGDFRSGELTAIMGPSGAGKSTLMDILAGFTTTSITGRVDINGENRDLAAFRRSSAYIMQDDNLQPLLTIDETMRVAADLKLRSSQCEKMQRIEEILLALGLSECRHTRTEKLSGGQRKRLAIALELVNNPPVMFFDEPTSGLDSVTSRQCLSLLSNLASQGRTVILTIHQPSATLFNMIDHLYVIANGRCVYTGGTKALVSFLSKHSLQCPTSYNPADFLMEICTGDYGEYAQELASSIENGKCNDWRSPATVEWNKIEEMIATRLNMNLQLSDNTIPPSPITPLRCERLRHHDPTYYATGFWKQLYILLRRNAIKLSRDKVLTFMRLGMHFIIAVIVGTIFYRIGEDAAHVFDNFNLLFFNIMFLMYSAFSATIITFPSELPIVTREHFNRWYKVRSFYLANKLADLPVQIAATCMYTLIVFFMTGQLPELKRLGLYILMCTIISLVAQIIGVIVGTGMKLQNAVIFGPLFIMPFLIFSGFFVRLNDAHPYMHWLFHTSFLKYGFEGVMAAIYGFGRQKMPCSEIYCHFATPEKLMSEVDMKNVNYWFSMVFLIGLYSMLDVAAYMMLRLRLKVRRAYVL